jgi:hypothetical protein
MLLNSRRKRGGRAATEARTAPSTDPSFMLPGPHLEFDRLDGSPLWTASIDLLPEDPGCKYLHAAVPCKTTPKAMNWKMDFFMINSPGLSCRDCRNCPSYTAARTNSADSCFHMEKTDSHYCCCKSHSRYRCCCIHHYSCSH